MIFAPEQSYQLDYAACDYKEGVTGFSAKLLLSVRPWREKLRRCFIRILSAWTYALVHQTYRLPKKYLIRKIYAAFYVFVVSFGEKCQAEKLHA
jgi:hypothetical protein